MYYKLTFDKKDKFELYGRHIKIYCHEDSIDAEHELQLTGRTNSLKFNIKRFDELDFLDFYPILISVVPKEKAVIEVWVWGNEDK